TERTRGMEWVQKYLRMKHVIVFKMSHDVLQVSFSVLLSRDRALGSSIVCIRKRDGFCPFRRDRLGAWTCSLLRFDARRCGPPRARSTVPFTILPLSSHSTFVVPTLTNPPPSPT